MSKKIKIIIINLIVLSLIMQISCVNAISETTNFFNVNTQEITQGSTLEMTLDFSKIDYENFEISLSTNIETNNIYTEQEVEISSNNNVISIDVDKTNIELDKIILYYQIPEDMEVGTKITLTVQVFTEVQSEGNEEENEKELVEEETIEVIVIETTQNENEEETTETENSTETEQIQEQTQVSQITGLSDSLSDYTQFSSSIVTSQSLQVDTTSYSQQTVDMSSISIQTEENLAVYNGSSNNYLANLEIEGIELNTEFDKENGNYFIEVSGETSLNITATAEDEDAKVCITGADNLKDGDNKVLISVTAENGNVRYYRIFVTNN